MLWVEKLGDYRITAAKEKAGDRTGNHVFVTQPIA
jgi:hypothetical protein